jgi:hypothetical protein
VIRETREYFVDFRPDCIEHADFAALDLGTYAGFYVEALLEGHREASYKSHPCRRRLVSGHVG